jgi:uncharacterized protein YbjT (DUF2867 family)
MATILLTGASGTVSSAAIRALQGKGHKLIGLVRDVHSGKAKAIEKLGVELRTGDLEKPRSVEGAFEGVDVAWILTPPGPMAPYQSSAALWGARLGKVKHVVRMSAVGAAHDAPSLNGRMHALSDTELRQSGIPFTIVKPHFFMQNLMGSAQSVAEQGVIYMALGDAKLPMVDVRDIGDTVAAILNAPEKHAGQTYTLTGAPTSIAQAATAIGEAIGKPVKYQPVPVATAVENIRKLGWGDFGETSMRDYLTAYSQGWQSTPTSAVKDIAGHEPRSISEFARDFAGAFGKK